MRRARGALVPVITCWCVLGALSTLTAQVRPSNDNFSSARRISGTEGSNLGSNVGATRESGEPLHAGVAEASVWWNWVAPESGRFHFDTFETGFNTVLAIYTGESVRGLSRVAENDDAGTSRQSLVFFDAEEGVSYKIAVDGVSGGRGSVTLSWGPGRGDGCIDLTDPVNLLPEDGATGEGLETTLQWNEIPPMVEEVIFGTDHRRDIYQLTDPNLLRLAEATVSLLAANVMTEQADGSYRLVNVQTMLQLGMCATERYSNQPTAAYCTGVLVGQDLVVTLCGGEECDEGFYVFGYEMENITDWPRVYPPEQVYTCQEVVGVGNGWRLVRLDRPVEGRRPVEIRREGRIGLAEQVFYIGNPVGLPLKYCDGGRVRDNTGATSFEANLDAYNGQGGAPVFNVNTLIVEGLTIGGPADFENDPGTGCLRSIVCPDSGAECAGITCLRTTEFSALVPPLPEDPDPESEVVYEVFFGTCGEEASLGETTQTSWALQGLEPETEYCWYVIARDACSQSETRGPTWSFTTGSDAPIFRRADVNSDGDVNLSDGVSVLNFLFAGQEPPECLKRADGDDDGQILLTDGIYILNYLFSGGAAPPPPFEGCGTDPTEDALACPAGLPCSP